MLTEDDEPDSAAQPDWPDKPGDAPTGNTSKASAVGR